VNEHTRDLANRAQREAARSFVLAQDEAEGDTDQAIGGAAVAFSPAGGTSATMLAGLAAEINSQVG
jgi:hypothetical protein